MPNFDQQNHPEILKGERWLTNVRTDQQEHFREIGWKTKRKGIVAYDIYGKEIAFMFPVFVQKEEVKLAKGFPNALT